MNEEKMKSALCDWHSDGKEDYDPSSAFTAGWAACEAAISPLVQAVLDWYDRDGSVGGASEVIENLREAMKEKP